MVNIQALIDDARCFETVRAMRRPDGVTCPECGSAVVTRDGLDDTQPERQRYLCQRCRKRFDGLSGTILAGHHQPLRVWILCLYFTGLNLSNEQIARELGIDPDDAQVMASQLRPGIVEGKPEVLLNGGVERVRHLRPAAAVGLHYTHRTVCHAAGGFARDEDGDGF